ncbi:MAG: putative enoyl-CoA hydratase/isomerase [Pseudonocardiales bacterium]|nr:putative enoyl-CoA hydratase/isomerase [Pseudonocardiales bacterium]
MLLDVDDDGVAVFTLNRPEQRNGWNPVMERRYFALLDQADADPAVKVGILTGAGRTFCPGVDTTRLTSLAGQPMNQSGRRSPIRPWAFRKPLIAAVNGGCAGIGFMEMLLCDVRFAARGAKFTTAFARRGLAGEFGVTWLLPRLIGLERAADLLLSGRTFDADEALALGLISRVVEPEDLLPAVRAYAADMARNCSPLSMALIRAQLQSDLQTDFSTALGGTYRAMSYAVTKPDFREGIDSYMQKRPPSFAPLAVDFDPRAVIGAPGDEIEFDPAQPT